MLIVAGLVHVDPSDLQQFVAEARATLPAARTADGNLFFSCVVDDPGSGSVLMFERWRDQAALDAYLSRPEVLAIFQKWGPRMRSDTRKYDASNERNPID